MAGVPCSIGFPPVTPSLAPSEKQLTVNSGLFVARERSYLDESETEGGTL